MHNHGYTLIELLIVIAIIGILAAIALPTYQIYMIRSKISESLVMTAPSKTNLTEYVTLHGSFPTTINGNVLVNSITTPYINRIFYLQGSNQTIGMIIVQMNAIGGDINTGGNSFQLLGKLLANGQIEWKCSTTTTLNPINPIYLPSSCQ